MIVKELTQKSVFQSAHLYNGIYTEFLIPVRYSPLQKKDVCGCWLLVFKTKEVMKVWQNIYETFQKFVTENSLLSEVVEFEPFKCLDPSSIIMNRGFNEAYTTDSYAYYLEHGGSRPNECINRDISLLNQALEELQHPKLGSQNREQVISRLITKNFIEGNSQLKWTDKVPWTLYIPSISYEDIEQWKNK